MRKYWLILAIIVVGLGLIIVISYIAKPAARKPTLTIKEQVAAVELDLKILELALGDYFSTHNTFPENLMSLTTPLSFIKTIPNDPFNMQPILFAKTEHPYTYIKQGKEGAARAIIYSYGPDMDDDNASVIYNPQLGTISDGDIVRYVNLPIESGVKVSADRTFLFENQQISKASDDNGIIDFMWAIKQTRYDPDNPIDSSAMDTATSVIIGGWQGQLNGLRALLEKNESAFTLIHEGATKPFARSIVAEEELDYEAPVPNFLSIHTLTRLMICQGKKFEAEGRPEKAIRNYIDIAKFGQSVGNNMLLGKLICMYCEMGAYKALAKLLVNRRLDTTDLVALLEETGKLEQRSQPLAAAFSQEYLGFIHTIERTSNWTEITEFISRYGVHKRVPRSLFLSFLQKEMIKSSTKYWTEAIEYSKKPYPEAITFDIDAILNEMDELTRKGIPDYFEVLTRDTFKKARARGVRIMAALELFKAQNSAYPSKVDQLDGILKPVPLDPFTESNFKYEKLGDSYRLYSGGPDMRDDFAHVVYDPTNGIQSPGDIIFRE
jgi:hypothetical protein